MVRRILTASLISIALGLALQSMAGAFTPQQGQGRGKPCDGGYTGSSGTRNSEHQDPPVTDGPGGWVPGSGTR